MSDFDPINVAKGIGRASLGPLGEFAPGLGGKADPLKLFEGDSMSMGGKMAAKQNFGPPKLPGNGDGIDDIMASLGGLDDKHRLDTSNAGGVSTAMGKDGGNASAAGNEAGGGGGGMQQAMQGIQQAIGMIMNILKMVMSIFGGGL